MIKISTIELDNIWQREKWVDKLRTTLIPLIQKDLEQSEIKYDAQDLEHQVVFRMLTDDTLEMADVLEEQKAILLKRMQKAKVTPRQLFCFGWNREDRPWQIEWGKNKAELYAVRGSEKKEIIFREITLRQEKEICKDIIKNYHYIHCDRCDAQKGMIFGFFIRGEKIPFAIEEVEPCDISRNYKKAVLMLSDVNYHTTVELTRFYSVPNTPKNLISLLDRLVGQALRDKGYEWMMTSVMPAFAKTKATTVAGGINIPLLAKKLILEFCERKDKKYELCVPRLKAKMKNNIKVVGIKKELFPVIEMIKPLVRGLKPNLEKNKLFYIEK